MLVGHWALNGDTKDYSGYGLDGAVSLGDGSFVTSKFGQGVHADNNVGIVIDVERLKNKGLVNLSDNSISFWMKSFLDPSITEGGAFTNWIFHYGNYHTDNSGGIGFQSKAFSYYLRGPGAEGWTDYEVGVSDGLSIFNQGGWIHYVVIFRGNDKLEFYMNGVQVFDVSLSGPNTEFTNPIITLARNLDGIVNDVRIYSHTLSKREIKELGKALVLHYGMDNPYVESTVNLCQPNDWSSFTVYTLFDMTQIIEPLCDAYDRKARFPLDLNLANMSMSMTSKQGFVLRGCTVTNGKELTVTQDDRHSIWLAGCVFNISGNITLPTVEDESTLANGDIAAFYTSWFNREDNNIGIPAGRIGVIGEMSGDSDSEDRDNSKYGGLELVVISKTTLDSPKKGDYYAPVAVMENGNWVQYSNYKHRYNAEDVTVKQLKEKIKEPESAEAEQSLEQYLQYNVSIDDGSLEETAHEKFSKIKLKRDSHENIAKATQEVDLSGSVLVDEDRRYILQGENAAPMSYKPFITNEIQGYTSEFDSNGAYTAKEEVTGKYRLYGAGSEVRFDVDADTAWKIRQGTKEDIVGDNESSSPTVTFNLSKLKLENGLEVTRSTTLNDKLTVTKNSPDGSSGIEVVNGGITVSGGDITASGQTVTASNFRGLADEASKVTNALTIEFNNVAQDKYDGSAAKTYNITPNNIGAATAAQGAKADTAIQSVALASGSNNGTLKLTIDNVATDNIAVKGLGSAAYTASTAYATAAQGTKADNAIPKAGGYVVTGDIGAASDGGCNLGRSKSQNRFNNAFFKGTVYSTYFDTYSDRRLKENIVPIATKDISNISAYEFNFKGKQERSVGIMAQDLQESFPELVSVGDDKDKTLSIKESKLVYYLLDEVRRLKKELKEKELIA